MSLWDEDLKGAYSRIWLFEWTASHTSSTTSRWDLDQRRQVVWNVKCLMRYIFTITTHTSRTSIKDGWVNRIWGIFSPVPILLVFEMMMIMYPKSYWSVSFFFIFKLSNHDLKSQLDRSRVDIHRNRIPLVKLFHRRLENIDAMVRNYPIGEEGCEETSKPENSFFSWFGLEDDQVFDSVTDRSMDR